MNLSPQLKEMVSFRGKPWHDPLPSIGDPTLLRESQNYWAYRGLWPLVDTQYQRLVRTLPDRFRVSPVYFGAEIEVENVQSHAHLNGTASQIPGWFNHADGSLRDGMEFVTRPMNFSDLCLALANLDTWMKTALVKVPSFSWRTSNHIHLNVRDMCWEELSKLILLYSIFELQMFKYAGTERMNSVFCVPLTKTGLHENLFKLLTQGDYFTLSRDGGWDKYSALGMYRLLDLGTVEFRHFPGGFNVERLAKWVSFILSLRVAATSMTWDQVLYYVKNLNTICNYRELQTLVFGDELSSSLGEPENSIQMLSNGVTFAKKCLVTASNLSFEDKSAMMEFILGLREKQRKLQEEAEKDPKYIAKSAKVEYDVSIPVDSRGLNFITGARPRHTPGLEPATPRRTPRTRVVRNAVGEFQIEEIPDVAHATPEQVAATTLNWFDAPPLTPAFAMEDNEPDA